MPIRARSHIVEELSVRRFIDALPTDWVYRTKSPDYGIDGEVEIFNPGGSSTGFTFNVQLRATDDAKRADRVRLEVDELDYYMTLDVRTMVVRYGSTEGTLFWQWASNIVSSLTIAEGQKTATYRFRDHEHWSDESAAEIRRTLEVRRCLASFPPSQAIPLRIELTAIPVAERYVIDRAIAGAIAQSRGALVRAANEPADVEATVRLTPDFVSVGIDTLTGVTFDMEDPTTDDYLASILYALVRLFRRQRLLRQAESLALLLSERRLAHYNQDLSFEACMALASDLMALARLAIVNNFHDQGPMHALIGLTIAKAPQNEETRRAAMDAFFGASLSYAREVAPASEAAAHYSIGNFYRNQSDFSRALFHYNRARHLLPTYLEASYFQRELAGCLFLSGRYGLAQVFYREAVRLDPHDPDAVFLLGDALMLSGLIAEALARFEEAQTRCDSPRLARESEIKVMVCEHLVLKYGSDTVPRRRFEADGILRPDGLATQDHLEQLLRNIDALNPLANYNLGIIHSQELDQAMALRHFLLCAFVQPNDVAAWANAAICALGLADTSVLLCVMSTAIHHMGAEAYDHFRANVVAQEIASDSLVILDDMAMQLLEESERSDGDGFTLRMLDGNSYQTMTILGLGKA